MSNSKTVAKATTKTVVAKTTKTKNTNPDSTKLISIGKPSNTGKVNKITGYKGVHKIKYESGKTMFRVRLMFDGVEYGSTFSSIQEAAVAYNKLATKFYGRSASRMGLLNVI